MLHQLPLEIFQLLSRTLSLSSYVHAAFSQHQKYYHFDIKGRVAAKRQGLGTQMSVRVLHATSQLTLSVKARDDCVLEMFSAIAGKPGKLPSLFCAETL